MADDYIHNEASGSNWCDHCQSWVTSFHTCHWGGC